MTKQEIQEKYEELLALWQDSGIWCKMSFEQFVNKLVELGK